MKSMFEKRGRVTWIQILNRESRNESNSLVERMAPNVVFSLWPLLTRRDSDYQSTLARYGDGQHHLLSAVSYIVRNRTRYRSEIGRQDQAERGTTGYPQYPCSRWRLRWRHGHLTQFGVTYPVHQGHRARHWPMQLRQCPQILTRPSDAQKAGAWLRHQRSDQDDSAHLQARRYSCRLGGGSRSWKLQHSGCRRAHSEEILPLLSDRSAGRWLQPLVLRSFCDRTLHGWPFLPGVNARVSLEEIR